jgi:hypothetical protein
MNVLLVKEYRLSYPHFSAFGTELATFIFTNTLNN